MHCRLAFYPPKFPFHWLRLSLDDHRHSEQEHQQTRIANYPRRDSSDFKYAQQRTRVLLRNERKELLYERGKAGRCWLRKGLAWRRLEHEQTYGKQHCFDAV